MKKAKMMKKYADLISRVGVDANRKQDVVVRAPVEAYEFIRYLTMSLYNAKCRHVYIDWYDGGINKISLMHSSISKLEEIPSFVTEKEKFFGENSVASIYIIGEDPSLLKSVDKDRLKRYNKARVSALEPLKKPYHTNEVAWCIAAVPTKSWATKVFPDLSPTQAMNKMWEMIYEACYVKEDNDPVQVWKEHIELLEARAKKLNEYQFKTLVYKNGLGTDLSIDLVKNHVWVAARSVQSRNGLYFVPNIPTQEIFTMPSKDGVNGVVFSSKPLSHNGIIINNFYLRFENGKVVEYHAEEGEEVLKQVIEFDEGASHLGEVALIPYDSPISNQGIVYQETLFDENASCHLALGQSFLENIVDGEKLGEDEVFNLGGNKSFMHVDFMIGTEDLEIDGIKENGEVVKVFSKGNFAI